MEDDRTLGEARAHVRSKREAGVRCPCCEQYVKVYRRTITRSQVLFLRDLFRRAATEARKVGLAPGGGVGWAVDVRAIEGQHMRGGDYSKLRYWGLIEPANLEGSSGHWAITHNGYRFLQGAVKVPRYAYVYLDTVQRFSAEHIGVDDAYREPFRLDEIMATA